MSNEYVSELFDLSDQVAVVTGGGGSQNYSTKIRVNASVPGFFLTI